ncbi:hypothetical protein K227x_22120 [Rubripirellula lacrimiformis]|uniref:Uncharacterized protein n=2 Tax=Rubripirellula lacrimiformis TaxID=1930273 RepID=A0A517N9L1_9BACT|nr:hypothetical protein K227x_22120 [Rubripirellula lacrimiformis]
MRMTGLVMKGQKMVPQRRGVDSKDGSTWFGDFVAEVAIRWTRNLDLGEVFGRIGCPEME